tara:strand:+ start:2112 stop:2663 length:552 start_codon:yes stop_codon:yes gene_type:complete
MNRMEAIRLIAKKIGNQPIVSANGYVSRDLFETYDKESNFYMIGSMGLASSIALGVAIKNPKKRVYVFDGDGNILMNLGSLATIGMLRQKNLIHIIFDNESHESTGGQPTHTTKLNIKNIGKSTNYRVFETMSKNGLQTILNKIQNTSGPIMIIIKISKSSNTSKRVGYNPTKIRDRFMNYFD